MRVIDTFEQLQEYCNYLHGGNVVYKLLMRDDTFYYGRTQDIFNRYFQHLQDKDVIQLCIIDDFMSYETSFALEQQLISENISNTKCINIKLG